LSRLMLYRLNMPRSLQNPKNGVYLYFCDLIVFPRSTCRVFTCAHYICLYLAFLFAFLGGQAHAHPHIFVDAKVEIVVDDTFQVQKLKQLWRFDPFFSATVILDFDVNGNRQLDREELETIDRTIRDSLAEFDFFQSIMANGRSIGLAEPDVLETSIIDGELYLKLENRPAQNLALTRGGQYRFTLYDPTFYVAVDFQKDIDVSLTGLPDFCSHHMVRPDTDNLLSQSLAELSQSLAKDEEFFNDPTASLDLARELAPKLEVTCQE